MDNKIFQLILHKTGEKFLQYVLNYDKPINQSNISDLDFNLNQIDALTKLKKIIEVCELHSNNTPNIGLKNHLFKYGSRFNEIRRYCEGIIPEKNAHEESLQFLFSKAIEFYPSLLLVDNNHFTSNYIRHEHYFPFNLHEENYVFELLQKNKYINSIIKSNDFGYRLSYKLSNGSFAFSFPNFLASFITRAFHNCCYRTRYNLFNFLDEVEAQFFLLESIAKGESVEVSYFHGIYGLRLDGVEEYEIYNNIVIRNINEINNPGIKNTISTATTEKYSNVIMGCTIEYKVILDSMGTIIDSEILTENNEFIDKCFNILFHSHILGLHSLYPPIKATFFDRGYPLGHNFPNTFDDYSSNATILNKEELIKIKEWFHLLNSVDIKYVDLTLGRIKSAICNRQDPIDSLLDAFIAWETMFSCKISTTNSVVKSIAKILGRTEFAISNTKLNELYDLRSSIVHGNPSEHRLLISKNPEQPNIEKEEIKKLTIDIALRVLKQLINDKELFDKTPEQRVLFLLNPTLDVCENCDTRKLKFD